MPLDTAKVKALREARGLTMEQAAHLAGMTRRQRWNAIESGEKADPSISTVQRIARALGVKVDDLLCD